jgi:hypothetical protein
MYKLFLNTTDNFLCNNLKSIFEATEKKYRNRSLPINLLKELENLELNSLVSVKGMSSDFEKSIKSKLRLLMGVFFMAIPLFAFVLITYVFSLEYSYAFALTFVVALLATMRMEKIVHRYVQKRYSKVSC